MTLDIFVEADAVAALGAVDRDLPIPSGEEWEVAAIGASASTGQCEAQFRYSADDGQTWVHPYSAADARLRSLHLSNGVPAAIALASPLALAGGAGCKVRITFKNYGSSPAEISAWINGRINKA